MWFSRSAAALGGIGAIIGTAIFLFPGSSGASAAVPLVNGVLSYIFNVPGILAQASSPAQSTSPYWWLASGGEMILTGGLGETIQSALPVGNPWRTSYEASEPQQTQQGRYPQNTFLLFSRDSAQNVSAQVYVKRVSDNLYYASNRAPYIGESLIARYQDANDYYYAGIRADGYVVIKKKTGGTYQTLASGKLFSGTYNAKTNPDLIPLGQWIGLKLVVKNSSVGVPQISLSTDVGRTGTWKLALAVNDTPSKYGPAITGAGTVGIESDYANAQFDNFVLTDLGASSAPSQTTQLSQPSTPSQPLTQQTSATSYDSLVLADDPVLYLTMSSPSSGSEKDQSGHGQSGTYKGGTPQTATLPDGEGAADFNGTSEYLTVPSSALLSIPTTGQLTFEGWIRPDTYQFSDESGDGYVDWMGKCQNYSPSCEWEARIYGSATPQGRTDRLSAYVFNASAGLGSAADWQPSGSLQAGQWLYVVAEYQTKTTPSDCSSSYPGTINIWVNGVEQDFAAHSPTGCMSQYDIKPKASNSPLDIGTMALDTFFNGAVGQVAVYDSLLSQSEIDSHYEAMTGAKPSGSCGASCTIPVPTP